MGDGSYEAPCGVGPPEAQTPQGVANRLAICALTCAKLCRIIFVCFSVDTEASTKREENKKTVARRTRDGKQETDAPRGIIERVRGYRTYHYNQCVPVPILPQIFKSCIFPEKLSDPDQKPSTTTSPPAPLHPPGASSDPPPTPRDRIKQERDDALAGYGQPAGESREGREESLAQELEMERKSRRQQVEGEIKSPLQDRSVYYKNSVMFTSSAT
ncbi:unnamed protein product [Phaedon cochleariae]|uniref:Uncharacterized protein n=1 Tax=Phaedon cochleariae TaxID=80249 RepID=A0A9N9SHG7_PHACE|nr:unnamed protein product [Phaedon cochleariae]